MPLFQSPAELNPPENQQILSTSQNSLPEGAECLLRKITFLPAEAFFRPTLQNWPIFDQKMIIFTNDQILSTSRP